MATNSRHRKNHKKKVNAYKQKVKDKKNSLVRRLREQFNKHFAEQVQGEVDKLQQNQTEE